MDKREFKVGDRVWSSYGWGDVKEIGSKGTDYPVRVVFDAGKSEIYTPDGFWHIDHKTPSLFHANQGKIEFDTDEPIELVEDQPIWVRNTEKGKWKARHFSRRAESGGVHCYYDGRSKHGSSCESLVSHWKYFRTTDPALDGASQ